MPPPMPNPSSRMTANPLKPVGRYRPGKAAVEDHSSSEEEESAEEEADQPKSQAHTGVPKARVPPQKAARPAAEQESEDEEGFVTEDEDETAGDVMPSFAKPTEQAPKRPDTSITREADKGTTTDEDGDESEEDEEEEDETSEEEESSSDDSSRKKLLRPTFIKKNDRKIDGSSTAAGVSGAGAGIISDEAAEKEEARRKEMADLMIKDKLEKDVAARAAGRKGWDDDDEGPVEDLVDDTDGLDPEAELAAWKLRELKRLKRDREAIEAREKEIQERERRRNLTQAERDAEDADFVAKQKEEHDDGRGKAGFLQRYHHKGAFFQDDETAEILRKRDLMGAKFVDEVRNREALPEYMQIRDMTKLGKKGRTRYKDLKGEDTGRWGDYARRDLRPGGRTDAGGGDYRNLDGRFQPDRASGGRTGPTGANASAVGHRFADGDDDKRRRRSPSPYLDREKRRRLEAT